MPTPDTPESDIEKKSPFSYLAKIQELVSDMTVEANSMPDALTPHEHFAVDAVRRGLDSAITDINARLPVEVKPDQPS